ncbi:MAG: hypothetical protein HeimC3_33590 [Candidatus Heimdallarchaeota archaeon LC_3]|nr:MAG: hypothetical protein HeimC3_33590 [Candidatus Heimdallarchaeota archaeon LC_3]
MEFVKSYFSKLGFPQDQVELQVEYYKKFKKEKIINSRLIMEQFNKDVINLIPEKIKGEDIIKGE